MTEPAANPAPSLAGLFTGFLTVGLVGFGGVLPWARWMVVEQRRWLTPAAFTDLLGLCQFLPGPNIINMSVALGARFHGVRGALVALAGITLAPIGVVLSLGVLYERYGDDALVQRALAGMAAGAAGLVLATALKIAAPLRGRKLGLAIAAIGFVAIGVLQLPLLATLLVLVPASILLHRGAR
ncbi:MAG: chromate transporter [Acetobacteraceae bacterium]|nr:chromate transporter [Acetobacteraceae bacterium]